MKNEWGFYLSFTFRIKHQIQLLVTVQNAYVRAVFFKPKELVSFGRNAWSQLYMKTRNH